MHILLRILLWTVAIVVFAALGFAAFTEAGELISAPSDLKVALGCALIAMIFGVVVAAGVHVYHRIRAAIVRRRNPAIRIVPTRRSSTD